MSENIIEVDSLQKVYEDGDVLAVDEIDFSIKKGEIFALLGPNGAGKTTTISMLATLLFPTNGEAIVNSYNVEGDPDAVRKSIGMVFQEPSLDGDLTGYENLELHAVLYGKKKEEREKKIKEVLDLVDMTKYADMYAKNYSGGMKRRLEIARGLLHNPAVLLLDEPTLGLDPQTRRKIWEKIKELNRGETQMTILITTHYMEEADELADRICIMDHGKIIAMDTAENLKHKLSGDVIELEFEGIEDPSDLASLIKRINSIEGVKNVSRGSQHEKREQISFDKSKMQKMPNVSPQIIREKINQMLSNPENFVQAVKSKPMAAQAFLKAPFDKKKRLATQIENELLKELPENIQIVIKEIQDGEYSEENGIKPQISISCDKGGKQLSKVVEYVNSSKLEIKTIHMHQPTLEDVFLHYTGRAIREEDGSRTKNIRKLIQMKQLRKKR
ncbi:MAG: ATP-binding cassette domain-containing protein [Promethearchaeia archaeon]